MTGSPRPASSYDALGRCLSQRAPGRHAPRTPPTTGSAGRPRSSTPPAARRRSTYTAAGRVHTITDPSGRVTTFEYDGCGRAVARTDAAGRRWAFIYDADGALNDTIAPAARTSACATTTPAGSSSGTRAAAA